MFTGPLQRTKIMRQGQREMIKKKRESDNITTVFSIRVSENKIPS